MQTGGSPENDGACLNLHSKQQGQILSSTQLDAIFHTHLVQVQVQVQVQVEVEVEAASWMSSLQLAVLSAQCMGLRMQFLE